MSDLKGYVTHALGARINVTLMDAVKSKVKGLSATIECSERAATEQFAGILATKISPSSIVNMS